jgi:hypothetical protein
MAQLDGCFNRAFALGFSKVNASGPWSRSRMPVRFVRWRGGEGAQGGDRLTRARVTRQAAGFDPGSLRSGGVQAL